MKKMLIIVCLLCIVCFVSVSVAISVYQALIPTAGHLLEADMIPEMISQFNQTEIYDTVHYMSQVIGPRYYGTSGNTVAASYLYNRLGNASSRLSVEYQGAYENVIGTLQANSSKVYVVGAHYDTVSNCPGATDNAGGCAIVLEMARILCQYNFTYTVKFALWNREEGWSPTGATVYVQQAAQNTSLYLNYDSSCYDPDGRFVLDIMYNSKSVSAKDVMTEHNTLYNIGFSLTYNAHTCSSDHTPFWSAGYVAVMTHSETHGAMYHSSSDTIDKISAIYAKKNGQLGMSIIAELAQITERHARSLGDVNGDGSVDMADISLIIDNFMTSPPNWNPNCDVNNDLSIDMVDISLAIDHFMQS